MIGKLLGMLGRQTAPEPRFDFCDINFALHNARRFLGGRPRFSIPSRCGAIKGFGGGGGGSRRKWSG